MLYRVLKNLSLGEDNTLKAGEFTRLEWLTGEKVARLMAVGAVSEVAPPPLSEIPNWKSRAKRLRQMGIGNVVELLEAEPQIVASALKVKPATIKRWQAEAKKWLTVEPHG